MNANVKTYRRAGFTLVELMVVVAVIALLIAILLPAFSLVRNKAKVTDTTAQFNGLTVGLEAFREERALGGVYPPSAGDDPENRKHIANPDREDANMPVDVDGAHLLLHALLGADLLGSPGFRDLNRDGHWWNDTHRGATGNMFGIYHVDPNSGEPRFTRYGGAGYVDEKMRTRVTTLNKLQERGDIASWLGSRDHANTGDQRLFVDAWNRPILYYLASPAARTMLGGANGNPPGIYRQADNSIITGTTLSPADVGIDFGAGRTHGMNLHKLTVAAFPPPIPPSSQTVADVMANDTYEDSMARFIVDTNVTARIEPVRKDSFLLISAGPDAQFGTTDDITNWSRNER